MKPILIALTLFALAAHSIGQVSDPTWKFSLKQPGEGWEKPDFDDTSWKEGAGGFGHHRAVDHAPGKLVFRDTGDGAGVAADTLALVDDHLPVALLDGFGDGAA